MNERKRRINRLWVILASAEVGLFGFGLLATLMGEIQLGLSSVAMSVGSFLMMDQDHNVERHRLLFGLKNRALPPGE